MSATTTETRLAELAVVICTLAKTFSAHIIELGEALLEARALLPSDEAFGKWRRQMDPALSKRMAMRFMTAARMVRDIEEYKQSKNYEHFGGAGHGGPHENGSIALDALTFLLRDGVEEDRRTAVAVAKTGKTVDLQTAKEIVAAHKAAAPTVVRVRTDSIESAFKDLQSIDDGTPEQTEFLKKLGLRLMYYAASTTLPGAA